MTDALHRKDPEDVAGASHHPHTSRGSARLRGWTEARELFEESLAEHDEPRAHDGLGRTMWWLGSADLAIDHREQAFAAYKAAGETTRAAEIAIWLAREHLSVYGNDAVANGWLARARRLVGDAPTSAKGQLDLALAKREVDPAVREELADRALSTAQALGDADLEVAALAELGLAALQLGRVDDGLDRLDEAMAAATGGEADMLETVAEACCSLVAACDVAGDTGRLEQWARIVSGFIERRADLVVFTWGWEGDDEVPPGSTTVQIELAAVGEATTLTLEHSGLPSGHAAAMHEEGWRLFGSRLAVVATGGDPGPMPPLPASEPT
ncbi:MAG: SRPBCC domain-containing protein [Actinomycetota bacterium]